MTTTASVAVTDVRVVAVVQARLASQRLAGKVLRPMCGRPMLAYTLEALSHCSVLDGIAVATSTESIDDAIAEYAGACEVRCHRGPLADVAERMLHAGREESADAIVRISGDSPLIDPGVVAQIVSEFRSAPADLVTNVFPRSFPKGQSVEVVALGALERAIARMTTSDDHEHVTKYFYSHPGEFSIRSVTALHPRPELQLSVDTLEDFERCEAILRALDRPAWEAGWHRCAAAAEELASKTAGGLS